MAKSSQATAILLVSEGITHCTNPAKEPKRSHNETFVQKFKHFEYIIFSTKNNFVKNIILTDDRKSTK